MKYSIILFYVKIKLNIVIIPTNQKKLSQKSVISLVDFKIKKIKVFLFSCLVYCMPVENHLYADYSPNINMKII